MQNYIKLTFWNTKTNHDFTIQIQKENLPIFRLHDITNTLRLKQGEYVSGLVVNQYHIIAKTNEINNEIVQNYSLDEISIYENDKLLERFSVKLNNSIEKSEYKNNTLELISVN
jgi:hypothetical protein